MFFCPKGYPFQKISHKLIPNFFSIPADTLSAPNWTSPYDENTHSTPADDEQMLTAAGWNFSSMTHFSYSMSK